MENKKINGSINGNYMENNKELLWRNRKLTAQLTAISGEQKNGKLAENKKLMV